MLLVTSSRTEWFSWNGSSGKTSGPCRKTPTGIHVCIRGWRNAPWQISFDALRTGFMQVSASQVFLDHLVQHRPEEPVLFLTMLVIAGLEIFVVIVQYLPQGGIGGLSWVVNWHTGRHEKPLVREGRVHSPPAPMPDVSSHSLSFGRSGPWRMAASIAVSPFDRYGVSRSGRMNEGMIDECKVKVE